jgi:hypothetical protein
MGWLPGVPAGGVVAAGQPPTGITGRAQYGPGVRAQAAHLVRAHHVPVAGRGAD